MQHNSARQEDLTLAFEMAELAATVALRFFQRGVTVDKKPDGSPVTEADLEVERRLLDVLSRARPHDAVLSEERGALGSSTRRWILDPIDGTAQFATGRDCWGTHVALERDREVVLGVITRPLAGKWWWAAREQGTYRGELGARTPEKRLSVSDTADFARARVMVWARGETALDAALRASHQWMKPTFDAVLEVATGQLDALVDTLGEAWDLAPAVPIVEEAGGRFFDRDGGRSLHRVGGCFTNGRIDQALQKLKAG